MAEKTKLLLTAGELKRMKTAALVELSNGSTMHSDRPIAISSRSLIKMVDEMLAWRQTARSLARKVKQYANQSE